MAANRTRAQGRQIPLTPTDGGVLSGDPCLIGQVPAVSLNGGGAVSQVIDRAGVYALSVKGVVSGPANSAVAQGDILYYNSAHTPKIDKDTGGVRFGYAMGTVVSGATSTIDVILGY